MDRTREIADTARIIEAAGAGVVLTRGGDTVPLPGLPEHRLLAPGSCLLATAARELADTDTYVTVLAPTTDSYAGDGRLVRVSALDCARPPLDCLRAAVLLSAPGDLRGLIPLDLRDAVLESELQAALARPVDQGLPAIAACLAEGISINVTLIFSVERDAAVVNAFLSGMERARDTGLDLSTLASVASLFVSRVDTEVDLRLDKIGTGDAAALRGAAGIANARLAYRHHEQTLATDRWKALERAGARPQRPLWASTGVKDPAYPDTRHVVELVAPGVVNTMPEATLLAVADHGEVPADSVHGTYDTAERTLADLAAIGIDYDDVMRTLEDDGVAKFEASWHELGEQLARNLAV